MKVGDRVRIVALPPGLTEGELQTRSTFEKCFGHEFLVDGFDDHGAIELNVESVTGNEFETIWIEPEFVRVVS